MMSPGPPLSVPSTKARRRIVTEMPNCSASPAHTPAIIFPSRTRYQLRVSTVPGSSRLPQYRHLTASVRISSAQKGQRFVATSAMSLPEPETLLALGDDRNGAVGQREEHGERHGIAEDEIEPERRGQHGGEEPVAPAQQQHVDEEERGQRNECGTE